MPRNSTGAYSLPIGAFSPGGLIKATDHNSNYSDIATALTQSLATTGVSLMTGPFKAASGVVTAPSITFSSSPTTGFYLAGANQIGWAASGVQAGWFNSDGTVGFAGNVTFSSNVIVTGSITTGGATVTAFASGTRTFFAQAAAPATWTQIVAYNDYALRLISGAGGGTHGTKGFSSIFNVSITNLASHNHTLTDPGHTHTYDHGNIGTSGGSGGTDWYSVYTASTGATATGISLAAAGGGAWISFDVLYLDIILCQKN